MGSAGVLWCPCIVTCLFSASYSRAELLGTWRASADPQGPFGAAPKLAVGTAGSEKGVRPSEAMGSMWHLGLSQAMG